MPITSDFHTFAQRCHENNNELYEITPCWCASCDHVGYADILKTCIRPTEDVWYYDLETRTATKVTATKGYCSYCNGGKWDTTPPNFDYDGNPPYSRSLKTDPLMTW